MEAHMAQNGIHHITAITGAARRNLDFYRRTFGLRLVKKTVNFDDPGTYHFYYGDETGAPGTILTFFPWEHAAAGRGGVGLTTTISYRAGKGAGGVVDIREAAGFLQGRMGRGSVHHVAFRARDDAEQRDMAAKLVRDHRLYPTDQKNREYFRSIYFHEPGGILFEIATDEPGFTVDEPLADLGKGLKLPPFLEPRRKELEAVLPKLEPVS